MNNKNTYKIHDKDGKQLLHDTGKTCYDEAIEAGLRWIDSSEGIDYRRDLADANSYVRVELDTPSEGFDQGRTLIVIAVKALRVPVEKSAY
jgi:hypothetical protein